jgi:hypothetical protein
MGDGKPAPVEGGLASVEARERDLPPAARRALAEAEARRAKGATERPREIGGRGGEDPVRYGDWEVKGLAVDF